MNPNEVSTEIRQLLGKLATGYSGNYKIMELIGRVGMSDIYKAIIDSIKTKNPIN